MKKRIFTLLLAMLLLTGCGSQAGTTGSTSGESTAAPYLAYLGENAAQRVLVTSMPEYYEYTLYTFEAGCTFDILNYLAGLELIADFEENPNEYGGMTWVISIEYENGETVTVYQFGNLFIRVDNGPWYKMDTWQASQLESILDGEGDTVGDISDDWNFVYAKPVIYLYPEEETEVTVKLILDGQLTCTYPAYNEGWTVTAMPDGTLIGADGQQYNYLYWEGVTNTQYDFSKGFCVAGENTAAFLEIALEQLGINPTPDTLIRVFMAWYATEDYVEIPVQELTVPERTGFTVVEWGGSEVK